MRFPGKFNAYLLLGVALLAETACSSTNRSRELAYVERPVETIYAEATRSLDRRVWEQAALQFDEVQRQHPYSPWAQRALLMAAYARYRRGGTEGYEKATA